MTLNTEYLSEENNPFSGTPEGFVGIEDSATRDYLNALLAGITSGRFLTPYISLERVSKVLASYHIFLPKTSFLEGDSGSAIWPINQFGGKIGMNNDGEVVTAPVSNFSVYFEYRMSDMGTYIVFCEVVDQEELEEILDDVEAEMNDEGDDDLNEAMLAAPETGTRKIAGTSQNTKAPSEEECGCDHEEEEEDNMSEETSLDEALGDHAGLAKYADEHGRLDTDDLHTAAKHMKFNDMKALRKHLHDMDTDPRDKALEYVKKKHYAKLGYTNEAIDLANIIQDKKTGQIATKKGAPSIDLSKITQDKKTGQISAVNEVVTKRKMTSKELVARAAYLAKHKEKMAAADTGIKATKSFSDFNSQRGDFASEPSKMKVSPKSSPKYMDIKEEDKPPFAGPYEKKGEAKDKNVAKNIARKAMKAAVEKAKSKKK